jgi:hypothetical protein
VSLLGRLLGKGQAPPPERPAIALPVVLGALSANLVALEKKQVQPVLVCAQLADWVRDAGLEPPAPVDVRTWVAALDPEGWRRLALLVAALEEDAVGAVVAQMAARRDIAPLIEEGMVETAARTPLLTLALLRESTVRLEELARAWVAALDVAVAGETAEQSAERLARIDYGRLLSKAEHAKQDAEARMAELRKRQEQAENLRTRRSKW